MSTANGTNGAAVLDQVRAALAQAQADGLPAPGRPALVKLTGATDHQVRKAMAAIATSPTPASAPPAASDPGESPAHHRAPAASPPASRQAGGRAPRPWPLVLIGLAAAVAVWSGWVGLAKMAGFGLIEPLPGIADGFTIDSAIVLPISVEAYAAYALRVWLSTRHHSDRTIRFAKRSTVASLVIGAGAQVAYHLMAAAGYTRAPWPVVMLVAIVPVVVLGLASALAKLVTSDRQAGGQQ